MRHNQRPWGAVVADSERLSTALRHVRVGCEFVQERDSDTPSVIQVRPRPEYLVGLHDESWSTDPQVDTHLYTDMYGNSCLRLILPPGRSTFRYSAIADVLDETEAVDPTVPQNDPQDLPDDVLVYTLPSRFCLPDLLGDEAVERFEPDLVVLAGFMRILGESFVARFEGRGLVGMSVVLDGIPDLPAAGVLRRAGSLARFGRL